MKKTVLQIAICCLGLLLCLACVACGPSVPTITQATLGAGATEDDAAAHASTQFTTDTAKIYCLWKAEGIKTSTPVRGVWIAEDSGGVAPPNYKIDEASVTISSSSSGNFNLSKPTAGFPAGKYRLEIYFGPTLTKTIPFTVKAN
jgi:hypothetical protein